MRSMIEHICTIARTARIARSASAGTRTARSARSTRIARKLGANAGETIVEVLVAVLVSSMSMLMLAGAITAAVNIVQRSSDMADQYYAANNVLATGEARATDASGQASVTVQVKYFGGSDEELASVPVNYVMVEDLPGGIAAVSYRAQGGGSA